MPRVSTAQGNFNSGELSPLLDQRSELQAYASGAHRLENWRAITQGAMSCRPGHPFVAATKSNGVAYLIPFRFSVADRYMLEFGDFYMRVYRNKAQVLSGGSPYEIVTPYAVADIPLLRFVQAGQTMYLVHPSYKPRTLTRTAHTSWTIANYAPTADPFTGANDYPSVVAIVEQRLMMGATNNHPYTLNASKSGDFGDMTVGTGSGDGFQFTVFQEELNTIMNLAATNNRLLVDTAGGEVLVTSENNAGLQPTNFNAAAQTYYGSAQIPCLKVDNVIMSIQRDGKTLLSIEYDLLKEGFIADDRTILADHIAKSGFAQICIKKGKPNLIYLRRNDGIMVSMTYEPRQQVYGFSREKMAGTDAKVISAATLPSSNGPDELWVITERTINGSTKRYVEYQAEDPDFPVFDDYWSGGDGEEAMLDDFYSWADDMYLAQRQCIHLDSALVYDGVQSTAATLSATSGTGVTFATTGGPFSSGMVGRELWGKLVGRATITGYTDANTVTVSISAESEFESTSLAAGDWYITASAVSGLSHLEGETVSVIADGGRQSDKVVSSGAITLDGPGAVIVVGLKYNCVGASMILQGGSADGPSNTKPKNMDRLSLSLLNAIGVEYGTSLYYLNSIEWREPKHLVGRPPPLFSGDKVDLKVSDDWLDTQKRVYLVQREPQPATVILAMHHMTTNDT